MVVPTLTAMKSTPSGLAEKPLTESKQHKRQNDTRGGRLIFHQGSMSWILIESSVLYNSIKVPLITM